MANYLKDLDADQVIRSVYDDIENRLRVDAAFTGTLEVNLNNTSDSVQIFGNDGTVNRAIKTDTDGNLQVDVLTSGLPAGAATEATLATVAKETTLSAINAKLVSGTDIGDVTINNAAGASAVNIQDGGNSITIDGAVAINNAAGASAVNIQDGGNSITVDGTVLAGPAIGAITNRSVTVTATDATVVPANATRKYLFFQNLGSSTVWLDFNTAAVAASPSIRLQSSDVYIMEGSFISNDAIHSRTTSGSSTVVIKEG